MASLGHIAVGMAAGRAWINLHSANEHGLTSLARAMVAFSALSLVPDVDVVAFRFGIPYSAPWGHRGAAHSLVIALALATVATFATRLQPDHLQSGRWKGKLWLLAAIVTVSHGLLDSLTDGGLGVALLWPFLTARYFAPWRPIPVAPIGSRMLSSHGLRVVIVEALEFAPLLLWAVWPRRRPRAG